jgi:hypothetical protein
MVQRVGLLDALVEVVLLLFARQCLVCNPRSRVLPLGVTLVLVGSERLCEVLNVVTLLALPPRNADLDDVTALVHREQTSNRDVATGILRDFLDDVGQLMRFLERCRLLLACHSDVEVLGAPPQMSLLLRRRRT